MRLFFSVQPGKKKSGGPVGINWSWFRGSFFSVQGEFFFGSAPALLRISRRPSVRSTREKEILGPGLELIRADSGGLFFGSIVFSVQPEKKISYATSFICLMVRVLNSFYILYHSCFTKWMHYYYIFPIRISGVIIFDVLYDQRIRFWGYVIYSHPLVRCFGVRIFIIPHCSFGRIFAYFIVA